MQPDPGSVLLLVDDSNATRAVTASQLRQLGVRNVLLAANGADALRILQAQPVTLILANWNLSGMSGLDLLRAVRSDPMLSYLPFVMLTSEIERSQLKIAIDAGVSEFIVKPYTMAFLEERLARALSWRRPVKRSALVPPDAAQPPAGAEAAPPRSIPADARSTLLLVDDTPDNLHLLAQIFKKEYRIKLAQNGEKALAICQSDTPPDLVLLDVMMPDMDGFEVARRLRSHPGSEHIPVIFVTAMTGKDAMCQGMELGAVDFVTKPVDAELLRLRVRNFVRYVELHRQLQGSYDEMLASARLKEDVEQIIRHDLKRPIANVIGLTQELAQARNLTVGQRELLLLAEETALSALNQINLSTELYRIETGRFELVAQPVNVAEILRRLVELALRTFAARRIEIDISTSAADDGLVAQGDATLCYSLFQNLLQNACEAAPDEARIAVRIARAQTLDVEIENPGVVPQEIRATFLEKFSTAGKPGGTGLGTYSARLLTEAQHGRIEMATDDERQRTVVTVRLPL